MSDFKVSCIQIASGPNIDANLLEVGKYIEESKKLGAKIVILPENFAMMAASDTDYLDIMEDFEVGKFRIL